MAARSAYRTIYLGEALNNRLSEMGLDALNVSEFFRKSMLSWVESQKPVLEVDGKPLQNLPAPRSDAPSGDLLRYAEVSIQNAKLAQAEVRRRMAIAEELAAKVQKYMASGSTDPEFLTKALEETKGALDLLKVWTGETVPDKVGEART